MNNEKSLTLTEKVNAAMQVPRCAQLKAVIDEHINQAEAALERLETNPDNAEDHFTIGTLYAQYNVPALEDYAFYADHLIAALELGHDEAASKLEDLSRELLSDTSFRKRKLQRHIATDDGVQGTYNEDKVPAKMDVLNEHLKLVNRIREALGVDLQDLQDIPVYSS